MGERGKPAKVKAGAKASVAGEAQKGKGSEFEPRLAASAQHAAISEILRVISDSPGDVQPVLDAVAERAAVLCDSPFARVMLVEGEVLRAVAAHSTDGTIQARTVPIPLKRTTITGRAVLDRVSIHHDDVGPSLNTEYPDAVNARRLGVRAVLAVPLIRERNAYGAILLFRREPRAFSPDRVALVETFAQQAAIAIDNARLFNETKEALEQQTAISEILRVIASSPGALKPMLKAVVERALKLCDAADATIFLLEGDKLRAAARFGSALTPLEVGELMPLTRGSVTGRAVIDRSVVHIEDLATVSEDDFPVGRAVQRRLGHHTALSVPLMREDHAIGAIALWRMEVRRFTDKQIALVKTFADQAAIAIENVRLFDEVQVRTRELSESLQQQTATADVLKVISRSAFDLQTVLDTLTESACTLCEAEGANIWRPDADGFKLAAMCGQTPEHRAALKLLVIKPGRDTCAGRALLEGRTVHIHDAKADPEYNLPDVLKVVGNRAMIGVPLLREGAPIGVLVLTRTVARPFTEKQIALATTFADQAVIAIENVRLFNETKEALERQTATSEVLRVISGSPTDVQPVFETIVASAARLCSAESAAAYRFDGEMVYFVAGHRFSPEALEAYRRRFPRPLRETDHLQRVVGGSVLNIPDVEKDPHTTSGSGDAHRARGVRSNVIVPMVREGQAIGAIGVSHRDIGAFSDERVALLQTFADQAVIAIENVRLFNETKEALDRQTATSDILRVMSQSPTDVQPVFDTIVGAARRLCEATSANVVTFDGELIHLAAFAPAFPEGVDIALHQTYPRPPSRDTANARAVLTRSIVVIPDVLEDRDYAIGARAVATGYRSILSVPLMREETPIGAITVARAEPGSFPEKQIALLQTFADQAVIAIENVRLFTELTHKNRELTQAHAQVSEALERQTATSEILRVISESPTDVQPVFETIATAAMKLCGGNRAHVFILDSEQLHVGALASTEAGPDEEIRRHFPRRLGKDLAASRAILTGGVVVIPDVLIDPEYALKALAPAGAFRSVLGVPLLREGSPIGAIAVSRPEPGPFPDNQIALLQTFAAQAVIAIENVRLFNETKEALEQQTATADILRVISQSPRDVQPVFEIIAQSALRLCNASSSNVVTYDGQLVRVAAQGITDPEGAAAIRKLFPRPPDRGIAATRAIVTADVVAISDVMTDAEFSDRTTALAGGFRSVLAVPLLRSGKPIGAIAVGRPQPGSFPDKQVNLLRTFADQAVIAIENVRLFTELEARTLQLTRSVGELKALGEVGQAVSSTLDLETVLSTIVSRATALAGMDAGAIYEYDEARGEFHLHTADRLQDEVVTALRAGPIRKGEGALGRMAMAGEPAQIRDIMTDASYQSRLREVVLRLGYRSLMAVPLMRDDHLLGGLVVYRKSPGEFDAPVIDLLRTFATQSALAIQNARLFREIEVKSRELEAASRHKSEFLANMSHELRTPLNAIIGFSEVLSERMFGEINQKQAEYIGDILQSGQHLLSLINDILDLSKIEAGRMELELGEFDLPSTIENTLILVRERAQRRGIALTRAIDERLGVIRADERKVKQVLLNLLSNAVKFTPDGGKITVSAAMQDGAAEISVVDTGVGISPEDQASVFEEFRQVGTASKKVEGTGLGLAISRKFIELHGGRIWVKSEVGSGSTFAFTLPLRRTSPA